LQVAAVDVRQAGAGGKRFNLAAKDADASLEIGGRGPQWPCHWQRQQRLRGFASTDTMAVFRHKDQ
jgi:hypothetical protein